MRLVLLGKGEKRGWEEQEEGTKSSEIIDRDSLVINIREGGELQERREMGEKNQGRGGVCYRISVYWSQ